MVLPTASSAATALPTPVAATAEVLVQRTTRTIGSAGDARAVALYAELAAVTTAVAHGLSTAPAAAPAPTPEAVAVRQRGSDLHLGAATQAAARTTGLLADLQSVLDGVHAQAGQGLDRGVVEQLVLKL
ncbi:hypothetical protein GCM10025783_06290 [Amnibacterium soli]|uniref:Uncharacterized protein n=1 Tax=Amnibacterium soli TaxID=1282736 RepID=A0ABP8YSG2_9MICO